MLLCVGEALWELDLEGEDEVAAAVVHHKWRKGIVIVDWHALAIEYFLKLW